jgi:hypothetical protein
MREQTSDIVSAGSLIAVLVIAGILANAIAIKRALNSGAAPVIVEAR